MLGDITNTEHGEDLTKPTSLGSNLKQQIVAASDLNGDGTLACHDWSKLSIKFWAACDKIRAPRCDSAVDEMMDFSRWDTDSSGRIDTAKFGAFLTQLCEHWCKDDIGRKVCGVLLELLTEVDS